LSVKTIDKSIELYFDALDKGYDSVYSVTRFQSRFYWENGKAINHNPAELIRTQDLSPIYEENSNFYIFSRNSFNNANKKRIGLKPLMCEVNKKEAIDIDDLDDFIIAEAMAKIINNLII
jgi:N-acylneuraminate cytidylyltransferase